MQIKKYPHKNLNKHRIIYFQIGLCVVLILLLISVEWKSYSKPIDKDEVKYQEVVFEEMPEIKIPEIKPEKISLETKPKEIVDPITPDEKDSFIEDPVIEEHKIKFDPDKVLINIKPTEPEPIEEVSWISVEDVPIFPGCEVFKDNNERRSCMQDKLANFIGKHFDTQLASGLNGKHVIYTKFKVSHTGEIIFMGARNPNPELAKEAERVIKKLPKMIPGKQRDKPVDVLFGLPINFNVDN